MNRLHHTVLKTIARASNGDPRNAVSQHHYRQELGAFGEVDLALAIMWLQERGYITRISARNLGPVRVTELGTQILKELAYVV